MLTVYLLSSNVCISSSVSINLYRSNSSWSNIFILIKFYWQVDILAVVLGKTLNKKCMSRSEHELSGSQEISNDVSKVLLQWICFTEKIYLQLPDELGLVERRSRDQMLTSDWLWLPGQEGGRAETRGGETIGGHEHPLQPLRQTL